MAAKLTREEKYMKAAIREAKKAWALGEVPNGLSNSSAETVIVPV